MVLNLVLSVQHNLEVRLLTAETLNYTYAVVKRHFLVFGQALCCQSHRLLLI